MKTSKTSGRKPRARKRLTPSAPYFRSAITNGLLLAGVDGRSAASRRYRDLFQHYQEHTSGKHVELCKQAAALVMQRELLDAALVRGEDVNVDLLVRLSGAIARTLERLGLAKPQHRS